MARAFYEWMRDALKVHRILAKDADMQIDEAYLDQARREHCAECRILTSKMNLVKEVDDVDSQADVLAASYWTAKEELDKLSKEEPEVLAETNSTITVQDLKVCVPYAFERIYLKVTMPQYMKDIFTQLFQKDE